MFKACLVIRHFPMLPQDCRVQWYDELVVWPWLLELHGDVGPNTVQYEPPSWCVWMGVVDRMAKVGEELTHHTFEFGRQQCPDVAAMRSAIIHVFRNLVFKDTHIWYS